MALAAAGLVFASASSAFAIDLSTHPDRNQLIREGRLNELETLQSRQNRIEFQREQRQFRQQDRQVVQQPLRLRVPKVHNGCQAQVFGNAYAGRGSCR